MAFNAEAYHGDRKALLHAYIAEHTGFGPERDESVVPDTEYWGKNPPKEIFFASYSLRKAMIITTLCWLNELQRRGEDPEQHLSKSMPVEHVSEFYDWMRNHIFNGDNAIPFGERFFLGYYHGVPIYLISVSMETHQNTQPVVEATLKSSIGRAHILLKDPQYAHEHNVIVMSADTIAEDDQRQQKGKPAKDPGYPRREDCVDDAEFKQRVHAYNVQYLADNYHPGSHGNHVTGIAMASLGNGVFKRDIVYQEEFRLPYTVPDDVSIEKYPIDAEAGGGGVLNLIYERQGILQGASELTRFLTLAQVMGVPLHGAMEFARQNLLDSAV